MKTKLMFIFIILSGSLSSYAQLMDGDWVCDAVCVKTQRLTIVSSVSVTDWSPETDADAFKMLQLQCEGGQLVQEFSAYSSSSSAYVSHDSWPGYQWLPHDESIGVFSYSESLTLTFANPSTNCRQIRGRKGKFNTKRGVRQVGGVPAMG